MTTHLVKRLATLATGALLTGSLGLAAAPAQAAPAAPHKTGTTSLAEVLAADGAKFDRNWKDFDILDAAVTAVLKDDPKSPVAVLADGKTRLTAFLPTDGAFRTLVKDLTGSKPTTEKATVKALLSVADLDTIETVLLYHVVPGKTLASPKVLAAAKADTDVKTAQGGSVELTLQKGKIAVEDADPDIKDARVVPSGVDINKGNRQIGHAVNRVLLPIDL